MTRRNHRRGANAIEFALLFPLFIVLTLGGLEYSYYFVKWQAVIAAAQDGARAGSQTAMPNKPDDAAEVAAQATLARFFPRAVPSGVSYVGTIVGSDQVKITVTVPNTKLVGMPFLPVPASIVAEAQLEVQDLYN